MNHTWHWHPDTEHPYLTTSLLKQWRHGFFSRQSWPATPTILTQVWTPDVPVYWAKQVHGKQIVNPSDFHAAAIESSERPRPEADAVITTSPDQGTWVCTADCTPMLIADTATGQVAAIHAGWRGTALRIGPETIQRMQSQGSQLSNLRIAMGPAIAGEIYQVSTQVAVEVGKSLAIDIEQPEALLEHMESMAASPILTDPEPGRVRLDIRRINELQLLDLGLDTTQIAIAPHCTYQEAANFFSYRRTREKKVQWSGIVSGS